MSNSPPTKSSLTSKKTNRPSLVVLADGKQTNFQRRRFNPDEFNPNRFLPVNNLDISDNDSNDGYGDNDDNDDGEYDANYNRNKNKNKKNKYNNSSDDDYMQPDFLQDDDFDARSSASTSAFSTALPPEEMLEKLKNQLDFSIFGDLFTDLFDNMDMPRKRELARFGRLQIVKKKNWIKQIWNLFDPLFYSNDAEGEGEGEGEESDTNGKNKNNKKNLSSRLLKILKLFCQIDDNPDELSPEFTQDPYAFCLYQVANQNYIE